MRKIGEELESIFVYYDEPFAYFSTSFLTQIWAQNLAKKFSRNADLPERRKNYFLV